MYAASADAVNDQYPNALHVLSHLLGMSIELALKAYLKHAGCSADELKSAGHDLAALYYWAQEFGLEDTGSRDFVLNVLGASYQGRVFAYPQKQGQHLGLREETFTHVRRQRFEAGHRQPLLLEETLDGAA
jgi:hypothetical protein